jgi:proline iminopeptidase
MVGYLIEFREPMNSISDGPDLFPEQVPFAHGMLDLDGRHVMYWEQCGNPDGVPVLFLHGGPGAGVSTVHRQYFDPAFYRIVLFDQRGAGRSRPSADIVDNTTAHLVNDIECLRTHLSIDRWLMFGGSWGATLALAYGISRPDRCLGFVLRGVLLGRQRELDWFLNGMRAIFPEAGRTFTDFLPEAERHDPISSYYRRLIDPSADTYRPAARAWASYENACSRFALNLPDGSASLGRGAWAPVAIARIECHYLHHRFFMPEGALLKDVGRIHHLPCTIIQGRYDLVCPPITAYELADGWPGISLEFIPDAGHSAMEPGIRRRLVTATQDFRERLRAG